MADTDPFAQYIAPEPKAAPAAPPAGDDPFAQYVAPEPAAPPPAREPSLVDKAKSAARAVGQSFADFGTGLYNTAKGFGDAVNGAIAHPVDTARAIAANPAAAARELARGVNDNIPFANKLVAALPGGAPEDSASDAAAFPNARALGNVAGLPAAGMSGELAAKGVGALGEKASEVLARRTAKPTAYQELGQAAGGTARQAKLMDVGPTEINRVDAEFGITKSPNPPAAVRAARAQVGAIRDQAFQTISAAGGDIDMGTVARRLDDLQADFAGKAGTRPFAADVAKLRSELLQRYGGAGKISPRALSDEISALSEGAYGGNYQNPKTAQIVQRRTAGALREVQDRNFEAVAKQGPAQADAVQAAREANQNFAALKTMEPIVKAKAVKGEFAKPAPSFVDKMIDAPVKTAAHAAKDFASGVATKTASGVARTAAEWGGGAGSPAQPTVSPASVAKLISAARNGATRPQLEALAQQDGTPPEIAANIAQQFGR